MKNKKIELRKGKVVTRDELYKAKEQFHIELSKLPFEDKIGILKNMRKVVERKNAG